MGSAAGIPYPEDAWYVRRKDWNLFSTSSSLLLVLVLGIVGILFAVVLRAIQSSYSITGAVNLPTQAEIQNNNNDEDNIDTARDDDDD